MTPITALAIRTLLCDLARETDDQRAAHLKIMGTPCLATLHVAARDWNEIPFPVRRDLRRAYLDRGAPREESLI